MVTMTLPLPLGREPEWSAAAAAVRDVRLAVVWDTGELYDWESWLNDTGNLPGAVPVFTAARAAQVQPYDHACLLRGAIYHGWPDKLIEMVTPTHRMWSPEARGGEVIRVISWGRPSTLPRLA